MARQSALLEHRKIIPGNLINFDIPNTPRKTTTSPSGMILRKLCNVPQHVSGICGEMHVDNVLPMLHKNIHVYSHGARAGSIPDNISAKPAISLPTSLRPCHMFTKAGMAWPWHEHNVMQLGMSFRICELLNTNHRLRQEEASIKGNRVQS